MAYFKRMRTLGRIADHPISRNQELLPWNLASSLVESG